MIADQGTDSGVTYDFLIIGAGVAGLSLAWRLGGRASVAVVEAESQPGYHASGRSAAMFMETYGTPTIQALTRAGRAFYTAPPAGFAEGPLLAERGVLYLVREDQVALRDAMVAQLMDTGAPIRTPDAQEVLARVPCVRAAGLVGAVEEPEARDVEVHELLQGFLRGARQHRDTVFSWGKAVTCAQRAEGVWTVDLADGRQLRAHTVVNAAGAWAQRVAGLFGAVQTGLQPRRRSAFTFRPVNALTGAAWAPEVVARWPAVVGVDESLYFKPDAGLLLGSPANADPVEPHDVVAEEMDIALGIHRITGATHLQIRRPGHTWAGLRTFAPDKEFIIGRDPQCDGFFWLAGQGGYGIQTAPGASLLAANLLLDEPLDASLCAAGVDAAIVSAARFAARH